MKNEELIHERRSEGGKQSAQKNYPKMILSEGYKQWRLLQPLLSRMNWERPEYRDAVVKALKERKYTHTWTDEKRESARQHALRGWSDPEYIKAHAESMNRYRNSPEALARKQETRERYEAKRKAAEDKRHEKDLERIRQAEITASIPRTFGIPRPVFCITNGKEYATATQAARELGLFNGSISNVCRGKQKSTKGYVFMYV